MVVVVFRFAWVYVGVVMVWFRWVIVDNFGLGIGVGTLYRWELFKGVVGVA